MKNGMVKDQASTAMPPGPDLQHHNCEHNLPPRLPQYTLPSSKPLSSCPRSCNSSPQPSYLHQDQDRHSLASQDSGIPTLEINHPEHIHALPRPGDGSLTLVSSLDQSPATLPLDPSGDNSLRKSSTFPRSSYDSVHLFSPSPRTGMTLRTGVAGGVSGTLNRSDDISVCSVSSLSTELSATLSVSNEDILDFMVTSDSSAIVTMETDEGAGAHFSDVTLSSAPGDFGDLWSPRRRPPGSGVEEDRRPKRLGPLASFFNR